MATVHGPQIAQHPTGKAHNIPRSRMAFQPAPMNHGLPPPNKCDPFYGHEYVSRLSARFITHLFACPELPPPNPGANGAVSTPPSHRLPYFIAYALHRTKLHQSVTFTALVLLQRLKARFPTARGSSGHRLYISAYMIASKVMCDDTYSNKSWGIVAQGMFNLREINQMEREMCSYLEWELNVDTKTLKCFETMVKKDFNGPGPYPTYVLSMFSKRGAAGTADNGSAEPLTSSTSPIPSFGHGGPPTKESTPPPYVQHQAHQPHLPLPPPSRTSCRPGKPGSNIPVVVYSPESPSTPSLSSSNTPSPPGSASPATPIGMEDTIVKVATGGYMHAGGNESLTVPSGFTITAEKMLVPTHPLKPKMFALAVPTAW